MIPQIRWVDRDVCRIGYEMAFRMRQGGSVLARLEVGKGGFMKRSCLQREWRMADRGDFLNMCDRHVTEVGIITKSFMSAIISSVRLPSKPGGNAGSKTPKQLPVNQLVK